MKKISKVFTIAILIFLFLTQANGQLNRTSGLRINDYSGEGLSKKSRIMADANFQGFKTVVWLDTRNDKVGLFGQILDQNDQRIDTNFQISNDFEEVRDDQYDVAVSIDNKTLIAYSPVHEVSFKNDVYYQVFDEEGIQVFDKKMVPPKDENQSSREYPAVAFLDDGSFVIAMRTWNSQTFDDNVFIQKFNKNGEPVSEQIVIDEFKRHREIDIVANANRILVVFERRDFGGSKDAMYAVLDSSLNILTTPTSLQTNLEEDQINPQLDKFSDHSFIASWIDKSNSSKGEVKAQRFDISGSKTGSAKTLGESTPFSFSTESKPFLETMGDNFMIPISDDRSTWKIFDRSFNLIATGDYPDFYGAPTINQDGFAMLYFDPPNFNTRTAPSVILEGVWNTNVNLEVNDDIHASDQRPVDIAVNKNGDAVVTFWDVEDNRSKAYFQLVNSKMEAVGSNHLIRNPGNGSTTLVAMAEDGSFGVLWREVGAINPGYVKVFVQFFNNEGQAISDSTRLLYIPTGTISGSAHGIVYNPTSSRYLVLSEPFKGGDDVFDVSIYNKSGQLTKPRFDLVKVGPFTKSQIELTPSGEFIISYYTNLGNASLDERKYYYSRLSSTGEVLEKNKIIFPEPKTIDNHFSVQANNTTLFVWRSNQDSVGPDNINEPIMIRGLSEQGTLGNISYLDVPGELFSVIYHKERVKIFTEIDDGILVTNYSHGSQNYQTTRFLTNKDYTQDNFKFVVSGEKLHVAYQSFLEKGRGLDVVYDVLSDSDEDGFFEQTDCNDSLANVNPIAMEIPNNDIDENCDGIVEREDQDGDGYFVGEDCNDMDSLVNPGQMEIPYNGKNDDCDSTTLDDDLDMDGFPLANDCNDMDPNINPDAMEIPNNGIDENCDGMDSTTNALSKSVNPITLYPNPVDEVLFIKGIPLSNVSMNLINTMGQKIEVNQKGNRIPTAHLPEGIYWLEIVNENTSAFLIESFVVKH